MKHLLRIVVLGSLAPVIGFAQESVPPPPIQSPAPPSPPVTVIVAPPTPPDSSRAPQGRSRTGAFLGIEVARVPSVLSEQLNLPEGFGVLVEYVVPGSAAETAGVKAHDILKLLNEQIITSAEQLSVLVRSFPEGQEVTLVILHKGQEAKLKAKLQPRAAREGDRDEERRSRRKTAAGDDQDGSYRFEFNDFPNADYAEQMRKEIARNRNRIEAATTRALEQAKRDLADAQERTARAAGSRLDFDRTHVILRDATGRIELRFARGGRSLKARDTQGKIVFDGAIDTPEQRKTIPADILPQVEALERERETVFPHAKESDDEDRDRDGAF